jgi:hypothetical protein
MAGGNAKEQGGVLSGIYPNHYNENDPITLFIIQVIFLITILYIRYFFH